MPSGGATSGDRSEPRGEGVAGGRGESAAGRLSGAARARAGGRVIDLRYDRLGKAWALEREIG